MFADFARVNGVLVTDLEGSERIRRCGSTEHPRSKNGAYFWDGRRGWVMAWDGDGLVHWFDDDTDPWTEQEKREWAEKRKAAAAAKQRAQQSAARQAAAILSKCTPMEHGYLHRKGLHRSRGLVATDESLVVPMRDVLTNELRGVQVIRWLSDDMTWEKKMLYGMRASGAIFRLGTVKAAMTVLCEGYATGLSIELAIKQTHMSANVLVCFSDHNLVVVAAQVKNAVVFADHDKSGAGERAAKATGLPYCMSDAIGEDANDLHVRAGLMAVCALLIRLKAMRVQHVAAEAPA